LTRQWICFTHDDEGEGLALYGPGEFFRRTIVPQPAVEALDVAVLNSQALLGFDERPGNEHGWVWAIAIVEMVASRLATHYKKLAAWVFFVENIACVHG
jgi:hypothetical protein